MPTQKQNIKKSIARVGYAPITSADDGTYTYGKVVWFESEVAGGRNVTAEPNGETTEIYADGLQVYSAEENNGYNLTVELLAAIDDIEVAWLGNKKAEDGTIIEIAKPEARPKFAFCVISETTNGLGSTTVYFNCSVTQRASIVDKTSEGSFDPEFPEYSIAARPRPEDKVVRATFPKMDTFEDVPDISELI